VRVCVCRVEGWMAEGRENNEDKRGWGAERVRSQ
jgi:hypothetical protein